MLPRAEQPSCTTWLGSGSGFGFGFGGGSLEHTVAGRLGAGHPVGRPRPGSAELPRAARRALRRHRSRAGRLHFDHAAPPPPRRRARSWPLSRPPRRPPRGRSPAARRPPPRSAAGPSSLAPARTPPGWG
eukprot:scaffold78390_cov42-Phaeocystis_antarctica.AAC.1